MPGTCFLSPYFLQSFSAFFQPVLYTRIMTPWEVADGLIRQEGGGLRV